MALTEAQFIDASYQQYYLETLVSNTRELVQDSPFFDVFNILAKGFKEEHQKCYGSVI